MVPFLQKQLKAARFFAKRSTKIKKLLVFLKKKILPQIVIKLKTYFFYETNRFFFSEKKC
jgi:hypothetical protein